MKKKSLLILLSLCMILNQALTQNNNNNKGASQASPENVNQSQENLLKQLQAELKSDSVELNQIEKFLSFKDKYSKNYTKGEQIQKFKNFRFNMERAANLTKKALSLNPKSQVVFGETVFSDLSQNEFAQIYLNLNATELIQMRDSHLRNLSTTDSSAEDSELRILQSIAPNSYDWRVQGAVSRIKNQRNCGSCWAFAIIATIESKYFLKYKKMGDFSEQNLVDCETISTGCNGGYLETAFAYAKKKGLMTEKDYPYVARKSKCKYSSSRVAVRVNTFTFGSSTDEDYIKKMLFSNGVLTIAVNATPLQNYRGGILDLDESSCDPEEINHAVNLVGYGELNGVKFWIVRNTWGESWGEKGYFRIARGKGTCGVNRVSAWVTIK